MRLLRCIAVLVGLALVAPSVANAQSCPSATQCVTYDALGRVTSVITTDGKQTIYSYDAAGNRTTVSVSTTIQVPPTAPDQTMQTWTIGGPAPPALTPSLGSGVTIVGVTPAQLGTSGFTSTTLTYTPPTGIIGGAPPADHFGYEVQSSNGLTASGVVAVPWAVGAPTAGAISATTPENTALSPPISPLNGQPNTTVTAVTQPANGTSAIINSGTQISYTPKGGYWNGSFPGTLYPPPPDTFSYTLTNSENLSASATVSMTVTATAPTAAPISMGVGENRTVTFNPLIYDSDPQYLPLQLQSVGTPTHGTASQQGVMINYQPTANYTGADSFSYTIVNSGGGTATATVSMQVGQTLSVSVTPTTFSYLQFETDPPVLSQPVVGAASGGQGPYSFTWQLVSGKYAVAISPNWFSTQWNGTSPANNIQYTSYWTLLVQDSGGNQATSAQVTVTVEHDNGD